MAIHKQTLQMIFPQDYTLANAVSTAIHKHIGLNAARESAKSPWYKHNNNNNNNNNKLTIVVQMLEASVQMSRRSTVIAGSVYT